MCIRLRIARWLDPEVFEEREALRNSADYYKRLYVKWSDRGLSRDAALRRVIARATPGANSTVKAMVKIAQDGLNGYIQ